MKLFRDVKRDYLNIKYQSSLKSVLRTVITNEVIFLFFINLDNKWRIVAASTQKLRRSDALSSERTKGNPVCTRT